MAHRSSGTYKNRMITVGNRGINVNQHPRLDALEKKLKLVAAAEGKSKGEVIADALDAYLPTRWKLIIEDFQADAKEKP